MRRSIPQSIFALLAAPLLLIASSASAAPGKEACANLELAASGKCELVLTGGCEAKCTPVSFDLACDGQCTGSVSATCTASCSVDCEANCTVNPGTFDCAVDCSASCNGSCESSCAGSADGTHCRARCKGECDTSCKGKCEATPPTATCKAKCDASCGGSCNVKADVDCHVSCEGTLKGGCETQCKEPKGALFCDGQYVDAANLDDCLAYLASINITVDASGSLNCEGGECKATGEASAACTTQPVGSAPLDVGAIATMAIGLGLIVSRRRRS